MKTVLITGASRGIGSAIAKKFAQNGYDVAINYNNSEKEAKLLAKELKKYNTEIMLIEADVSQEIEVVNMVNKVLKKFKTIDVLVNNAGVSCTKLIQDTTIEDIEHVFGVNAFGCILTSKEVAKFMISEKSGKIINISSIWGKVGGSMESVYSASKGAVIAFSLAMSKELAPSNINVNCVCPGVIDTDMMKEYSKEEKNELASATPLNRLGKVEDIANAVYFLASDNASFITGQVVTVDGGFTS